VGQDVDLDNKGVIFPDYFSFTLFKALVSGEIDIHTHLCEQSAVGGRDLFCGSLFVKDIKTLIHGQNTGRNINRIQRVVNFPDTNEFSQAFYVLISSLRLAEHLKVTTFLAESIISSPVAGFLPRRESLSFTQNFPNPLIRTSSPDARAPLRISKRDSTKSVDFFMVNPFRLLISSMI